MLTINKLVGQGRGLAAALLKRAATVQLDWDVRQKSRFDATDSSGRSLGVFLPRGTLVRGGDVLVAEDGSLIVAQAAPQPVLVVRHCPDHGMPSDLARAAYHLGNRHVALEVKPDHLKLEPDHVLAGMLRRMHLLVSEEHAPFEPEGGAYQAGHDHGSHAHGHGSGDDAARRAHAPDRAPHHPAPVPAHEPQRELHEHHHKHHHKHHHERHHEHRLEHDHDHRQDGPDHDHDHGGRDRAHDHPHGAAQHGARPDARHGG